MDIKMINKIVNDLSVAYTMEGKTDFNAINFVFPYYLGTIKEDLINLHKIENSYVIDGYNKINVTLNIQDDGKVMLTKLVSN